MVRKELRTNQFFDYLFIIAGIVAPVAGFCKDYFAPDGEYWFQRSGSIVVIASVYLELNGKIFKEKFETELGHFALRMQGLENSIGWKNRISVFTFFFAGLGTLIWGFGDLPFK